MPRRFAQAAAAASLLAAAAAAQSPCPNSGSLGPLADGAHAPSVILGGSALIADPSDFGAEYQNPSPGANGAARTTLAYRPELNPPASQPFSVEFWTETYYDATSGAGPCPLFNRLSQGNRTGWVWFQRAPGVGWNFAMYNGVGSSIGVNLTGGTAQPFTPNHLVATWDGGTARLYHNGALVASQSGVYVANAPGVTLAVGTYDNGDNAYQGKVDDLALYGVALSAAQVAAHYALGASQVRNLYGATVANDGALLHWRNGADTPIGARYCQPAVPNSRGFSAAIAAVGLRSAAANDVTLRASLLPFQTFGFFLTSRAAGQVPQPGGSAGVLCLGGAIGRYVAPGQVLSSSTLGEIELALDLTRTPTPGGLVAAQAGETWRFQAWYRDNQSGAPTSNFTDAVAVTFD